LIDEDYFNVEQEVLYVQKQENVSHFFIRLSQTKFLNVFASAVAIDEKPNFQLTSDWYLENFSKELS